MSNLPYAFSQINLNLSHTKCSYAFSDGKLAYINNGLEIYIFPSTNKMNAVVVKLYYGSFSGIAEV